MRTIRSMRERAGETEARRGVRQVHREREDEKEELISGFSPDIVQNS